MPLAKAPTKAAYNASIVDARKEWNSQENLTVKAVEDAYSQAYDALAEDIGRKKGPATVWWETELALELDRYRKAVSDQSLAAIKNGVVLSYNTGVETSFPHEDYLASTTGQDPLIRAQYKSPAEFEAFSYFSRAGKDGLVLSEKVWASTDNFVEHATQAVQDAVITGQSAKDLAKRLQGYTDVDNAAYKTTRIARTEIQTAGREGTIAGHSVSPFYLGVQWVRSNAPYFCDVCDKLAECADGKPVPGYPDERYYPRGTEPTSGHPNCRCVLLPIYPDEDEVTASMIDWQLRENGTTPNKKPLYMDDDTWSRFQTWTQGLDQAGILSPPAGGGVVPPRLKLPTPPAAPPPPVTPKWGHFESVEQAEQMAHVQYPNVTFDLGGMDVESANKALIGFESVAKKNPEVVARLKYVGTYSDSSLPYKNYYGDWKKKPNVYAYAMTNGTELALNPLWFGDAKKFEASLAEDVAAGFHPKGGNTIESVVQHEMGHHVENWLEREGYSSAFVPYVSSDGTGIVERTLNNWQTSNKKTRLLSRYALKSNQEGFAEAYAAEQNWTPEEIERLKYVRTHDAMLKEIGNDSSKWFKQGTFKRVSDLPPGPEKDAALAELARIRKEIGMAPIDPKSVYGYLDGVPGASLPSF